MKLVLSTSNIMSGGPSVIRRSTFEKSNTELTSSLRANFNTHQQSTTTTNGSSTPTPSFRTWTTQQDSTLYIPTHTASPLSEPREAYDITVKLFYLPNVPASQRRIQTREAIDLVLRELGTTSIDLLILSFPGISFDADDEDSDSELETTSTVPNTIADGGCEDSDAKPDDMDTMITTWRTLESLHEENVVSKLGISEFGVQRLNKFLPQAKVRPGVDQINVRDCCVVPKPLILYAKQEKIELLTHNDCTNVLPSGTLREILGTGGNGVGVLAANGDEDELKGEIEPQWVVKYTAVVKDRGVVESKGYFAVAELKEGSK